MKREIKFRGKRYGDGAWVYGNLYQGTTEGKQYSIILNDAGYHVAPQDDRNLAIAFAENEVNVVSTQTVGQFTGLLDKNGKEIYEGDIIQSFFTKQCYVVFWSDTELSFMYKNPKSSNVFALSKPDLTMYSIVGNIHDNPELLKAETLCYKPVSKTKKHIAE